ncbi:glycosyltransferase [Candidatus Schmidhempelia bombi str. Bimp]|uniref:Glycosyltransferase n=2 Tax=Candidatus Schmidhempelia TaxID=1505768 RepID=A0AB94IAV3_9GAMM|nr:glycosyltransferase [Candidatus Schmidhempelia bombi str. Bimp]
MDVLMVCAEPPYPANHGGRMDVMQKIVAFSQLGYHIDIIYVSNDRDDQECEQYLSQYVDNIYKVQRKKGITSFLMALLTLYPYQMVSRRQLKNINIDKHYDILVLESEHVFSALSNPTICATKKILRIHNDEYKYFKALMRSTKGISRYYYWIESYLLQLRKKSTYNACDGLWFISKDECTSDYQHGEWLPPNMPINQPFNSDKYQQNPAKLLFVGNLFTPNNLEAIIWFLEQVYPSLIADDATLHLTIAGSCREKVNNRLLDTIANYDTKNVTLITNPSDHELNKIYQQHTIFVNSMLNGAGVKLKTIDAMRNSMAVVSTSIGVEGTGLIADQHYKLADTEHEFYSQIASLIKNMPEAKQLAQHAYQFVADNFDIKNRIDQLTKIEK